MKISLLLFFLFLSGFTAWCQPVLKITVDQLNERISNGLDTTFVINFWAAWCSPCKKELPYFTLLQHNYRADKLSVLLINVDSRSAVKKTVIPYLKTLKKKDNIFLLDEKSEQEYIDKVDKNWSGALPACLFIKAGKRSFFEKPFTYPELVTVYKNLQ
jgi:thiol-disulfide isomerase/thioredoxin